MGASVLIFANKTDVGDCMTNDEIRKVNLLLLLLLFFFSGTGESVVAPRANGLPHTANTC